MRKHIQVHYQSDPHDPLLSGTSSPFLQAGPNALFSTVTHALLSSILNVSCEDSKQFQRRMGGLAMVRRHSAMPLNSDDSKRTLSGVESPHNLHPA